MFSCSCGEDLDNWYNVPSDFIVFNRNRRKRCCSCKTLIDIGSQCLEFERGREVTSDIEERIYGDEVEMAAWYMCEQCGEMYLNLQAIGYCHYLGDSMLETMEEYWDLTGFKPTAPSGDVVM